MAENPYLDVDRQMLGDIYTSSEPMDNLTVLCDDFGSRFGGTEGERLAARFMRDKFRDYGLPVARMEPYRYAAWTRGEIGLEVVRPVQMEIPCIALPYCPSAKVEAELVAEVETGVRAAAGTEAQRGGMPLQPIAMVSSRSGPTETREMGVRVSSLIRSR